MTGPKLPRTPQELRTARESRSFDASKEVVLRTGTHRSIPDPRADIESLLNTVAALKETVEILVGARGDNPAVDKASLPDILEALRAYVDYQKLDFTSPGNTRYGWRDIIAEVTVRGTGANSPSWSAFRNGISAYEFPHTSTKEFWSAFHIDHDFAAGSAIFPHVHFAPGNSALSGNVRWGMEYTIAKGHQQGAGSVFAATKTVYATLAVDANSNYEHHVAEVATGISSDLLEPDSLVLIRFFRDNTVGGNLAAPVWAFTSDIHYQYDRYGTVNRAPNFYEE